MRRMNVTSLCMISCIYMHYAGGNNGITRITSVFLPISRLQYSQYSQLPFLRFGQNILGEQVF